MTNKYIITGIAGGGKTTLINALQEKGYTCHEEVSRKVIRQQQDAGTNILPWVDLAQFSELVYLQMQEILQVKKENEISFFDRGIPDILAYLSAKKSGIPSKYHTAIQHANYNKTVFVAPPWEGIFVNDNQRPESFQEATNVYHYICETYQSLGFELYHLPLTTVEKRVQFILNSLR